MTEWLGPKPCGRTVPCPESSQCLCQGRGPQGEESTQYWQGLHNSNRHRPETENDYAWCYLCGEDCDGSSLKMHCSCCLAVEVKQLKEQVALVLEACDHEGFWSPGDQKDHGMVRVIAVKDVKIALNQASRVVTSERGANT